MRLWYHPRQGLQRALNWFPMVIALGVLLSGTVYCGDRLLQAWSTQSTDNVMLLTPPHAVSNTGRALSDFSPPSATTTKKEEKGKCEEPYGGLPCSTSLTGSIFLMVAYGYILLLAARMISDGSELLLEVLNPGLIGGLLLPTLGALPDALLITVSGISGNVAEAQEQVVVGVGVLAGSTVMILTLLWGGCVLLGRCDLEGTPPTAVDRKLTRTKDITTTGVTCDKQTAMGAYIMMATVLPYIVVQIPIIIHDEKRAGHTAALVGLITAGVLLVLYFFIQVYAPTLQKKKITEARLHYIRSHALQKVSQMSATNSWGWLVQPDGTPNRGPLELLFAEFDKDSSETLSAAELKGLIVGIAIDSDHHIPDKEEVEMWLKEFDMNEDGVLTRDEFVEGLSRWMTHVRRQKKAQNFQNMQQVLTKVGLVNPDTPAVPDEERRPLSPRRMLGYYSWDANAEQARTTLDMLEEDLQTEEEEEEVEKEKEEKAEPKTPAQVCREAFFWIFCGVALVAVFADPMVDSVTSFSKYSHIPTFFVAFVVTPLASNASEVVSSLIFAMKKKKRTTSLTFSQVYGAITMNNTLCMLVFLVVIYIRGLTWEFSAEVTIILIVTFLVGLLGGTRTTFPTWMSIPVILLYPLSLGLVAALDFGLGWK